MICPPSKVDTKFTLVLKLNFKPFTGLLPTPQKVRILVNNSGTQIGLKYFLDNDLSSNNGYKKFQIHQHNRGMHQYTEVAPYITEHWRLTLKRL